MMVVWAGRAVKQSVSGGSPRTPAGRVIFLHATFGIQILLGRSCVVGRDRRSERGATDSDLRNAYGGPCAGRRADFGRLIASHSCLFSPHSTLGFPKLPSSPAATARELPKPGLPIRPKEREYK